MMNWKKKKPAWRGGVDGRIGNVEWKRNMASSWLLFRICVCASRPIDNRVLVVEDQMSSKPTSKSKFTLILVVIQNSLYNCCCYARVTWSATTSWFEAAKMGKTRTRMKLFYTTLEQSSRISKQFSYAFLLAVIAGIVCCAGKVCYSIWPSLVNEAILSWQNVWVLRISNSLRIVL